jgi:hypothetical protein
VIREIKKLRRSGHAINGQSMQRRQTLYGHARSLFGSWERAVRSSGIDYDKVKVRRLWTQAALLDWIRRERKSGRDLRPGLMKKQCSGVFNAALREYGGWYPALRAAGIRNFKEVKFRRWSKDRVVQSIRKIRPTPTQSQMLKKDPKLAGAATYYFGNWTESLRAAGLEYPAVRHARKWTRERILEIIQKRVREGGSPVSTRFRDLGGFVKAATLQFGGWRKAVKVAGFTYPRTISPRRYLWTRNHILEVIRERDHGGKSNRYKAACRDHPRLPDAAVIEFGSWPAALKAAGCPLAAWLGKWTHESLLNVIQAKARDGVSVQAGEVGSAVRAAASRLFGGWKHAVRAAGLRMPPQRRKWSQARIVDGILKHTRKGVPLYQDHRLYQAIKRAFGGVKAAQKAVIAGAGIHGRG